jgi:hypothetical protein
MVTARLVLLVLVQDPQAGPAVGDTVWISRALAVPAGIAVRPRPIRPTAVVEPLGPPEVALVEGVIRIRYPVVAWRAGQHDVTVPGPILVRNDGWSDTLPDWTAAVEILSVLPLGKRDSLPPRPAIDLVSRPSRSGLPAALLVGAAVLVLVPVHWAWRRRGRAPAPAPALPSAAAEMLVGWAESGEGRAAAEGWRVRLEPRLATVEDPEVRDVVSALRAARYAPHSIEELQLLCRRAQALESRGRDD